MAFLEVLPISAVKVDRRLIYGIHKNKPQQLLLKSLLINLKSKDIKAIAEGVESEEDAFVFWKRQVLMVLRDSFFSRPSRMSVVEQQLKSNIETVILLILQE